MDEVTVNITETPEVVTVNITETLNEVTITVSEFGLNSKVDKITGSSLLADTELTKLQHRTKFNFLK